MQRLIILLTLTLTALGIEAKPAPATATRTKYKDGPAFIYRVFLTDKQNSTYTLEHPLRYLSHRSIERRKRQNVPIDSTDLPVTPRYIRQIESQDISVIGKSRWRNTVLIRTADTTALQRIDQLPFVKGRRLVWMAPDSVEQTAQRGKYHEHFEDHDSVKGQPYGNSYGQISAMGGDRLHSLGCRGEGMMIAVIDGGFKNVDRIPAFKNVDIRGTRDFVYPASPSIFAETDHGAKVLSTMALNIPFIYQGSAPKACYWLLRSEDLQTEQEVEEDYWTMAAEFADSVGCDLINSSLGYNEYDYTWMSHRLWELDGHSTFISQTASMLADKGIVLVNSAGNSGMGPWKKITVPADADNILTVGAITADEPRHIAPFSSVGPAQDLRIKPDVVAIGAPAWIVNGRGVLSQDMGTSFAAPIVCGLAACLWQALPQLTATELMRMIRQAGNNTEHPDNIYGYGLPDLWRAYQLHHSQQP